VKDIQAFFQTSPSRLPLALGGWQLGNRGWGKRWTFQELSNLLSLAFERGIHVIDTAPIYGFGESERQIGSCLQDVKGWREHWWIITKAGLVWDTRGRITKNNHPKILLQQTEESLKRLRTDVIDTLLVHWPDGKTQEEEIIEAVLKLLQSGKTKSVGLSNWSLSSLKRICELSPDLIQVTQSVCNLLEPPPSSWQTFHKDHGILHMGYSPLAQGLLSGKHAYPIALSKKDCRRFNPFFSDPDKLQEARHLINHIQEQNPGRSLKDLALQFARSHSDWVVLGVTSVAQLEEATSMFRQWKPLAKKLL
jgi:aryl-alcohol dehydrogenase-like predicted oxidoreductase